MVDLLERLEKKRSSQTWITIHHGKGAIAQKLEGCCSCKGAVYMYAYLRHAHAKDL